MFKKLKIYINRVLFFLLIFFIPLNCHAGFWSSLFSWLPSFSKDEENPSRVKVEKTIEETNIIEEVVDTVSDKPGLWQRLWNRFGWVRKKFANEQHQQRMHHITEETKKIPEKIQKESIDPIKENVTKCDQALIKLNENLDDLNNNVNEQKQKGEERLENFEKKYNNVQEKLENKVKDHEKISAEKLKQLEEQLKERIKSEEKKIEELNGYINDPKVGLKDLFRIQYQEIKQNLEEQHKKDMFSLEEINQELTKINSKVIDLHKQVEETKIPLKQIQHDLPHLKKNNKEHGVQAENMNKELLGVLALIKENSEANEMNKKRLVEITSKMDLFSECALLFVQHHNGYKKVTKKDFLNLQKRYENILKNNSIYMEVENLGNNKMLVSNIYFTPKQVENYESNTLHTKLNRVPVNKFLFNKELINKELNSSYSTQYSPSVLYGVSGNRNMFNMKKVFSRKIYGNQYDEDGSGDVNMLTFDNNNALPLNSSNKLLQLHKIK